MRTTLRPSSSLLPEVCVKHEFQSFHLLFSAAIGLSIYQGLCVIKLFPGDGLFLSVNMNHSSTALQP